MPRYYYVEFGGGLGDIFQQMYHHGSYAALEHLEADETATVALITHNPFAGELFSNHPKKQQLDVRTPGYWQPSDDPAYRRRFALPPFSGILYTPGPAPRHGAVNYYPTAADDETLRLLFEDPRVDGRPLVVFSASAGEPHRSFPADLVPRLVADVAAAGCVPVFLGRSYERNFRQELKGSWVDEGVELIDRLTVPGTARLVQRAAGAVCCFSSMTMLAWMERKPLLLLYPESAFEVFIRPRTQWAVGIDYPETVHARFDEYHDAMMGRFLMRVESKSRKPLARRGDRRQRTDVRDFLQRLPVTKHPVTADDYTETDWFKAWNGYPFYTRAAELIKPASVLEIGTSLGFGLASFAHGAPGIERLTALDNESDIAGSQAIAAENLSFVAGEKSFVGTLEAARGTYDLIHVDADQSFTGALHDMAFAWGLGPRVMLVDDYDFLEDVRRAVHTFADRQAVPFKLWKSYRGWAVFAEPDTFASLPDAL